MRLTVAPLRYGAGLKGKVVASLAVGLPCVATPEAVEGMVDVAAVDVLRRRRCAHVRRGDREGLIPTATSGTACRMRAWATRSAISRSM